MLRVKLGRSTIVKAVKGRDFPMHRSTIDLDLFPPCLEGDLELLRPSEGFGVIEVGLPPTVGSLDPFPLGGQNVLFIMTLYFFFGQTTLA